MTKSGFRILALVLTIAGAMRSAHGGGIGRAMEEFSLSFRATFQEPTASVRLDVASGGQSIGVVLSPSFVSLGKSRIECELPLRLPVPFILQCRKGGLTLACQGRVLGWCPRERGKCQVKGVSLEKTSLSEARFQPYEPVVFADDFMRTEEEADSFWETVRGRWALAKAEQLAYAASPFRFQAVEGEDAWAGAGHGFWRDYLCQVSLRIPDDRASAGLGFYTRKDGSRFVFRWNGGERRFELVRMPAGEAITRPLRGQPAGSAIAQPLLAQAAGGLWPRQWYRFGVAVCGSHVRCFVDEQEVLRASSDWLVEGAIGLHASPVGGPVDFDDVLVRGLPFSPAEFSKLPHPQLISWIRSVQPRQEVINETFQQDRHMKNWASAAAGWYREGEKDAPRFRHHGRFYKGFELSLRLSALAESKPKRFLLPGCTLQHQTGDKGLEFALEAKGKKIGNFAAPSSEAELTVSWSPQTIKATSEGKDLLQVPAPAYQEPVLVMAGEVEEAFWPAVRVRGLDTGCYTFYRAPADWWFTTGKWEAYSRWSCRPEWSFFAGIDDHLALIWSKRRFPKDVCLDTYAANPMVAMRPPFYAETSLNVTICGDGVHPFSGYVASMGGWNRPTTRLYRQDKLIAETDSALIPLTPGQYHRAWYHLQFAREGRRVLFFYEGQKVFDFADPNPLKGDRVGLWSRDPGISIARAQIFHTEQSDMWTCLAPREPEPALPKGWRAVDGEQGATIAELEEGGKRFVRLTNVKPGGTFAAAPPGGPFDVCERSVLSFRYRMRPGVKTNFYFRKGADWHVLVFTGPDTAIRPLHRLGQLPTPKTDGNWHTAEFDLLGAFRGLYPSAKAIQVDELRVGLLEPPEFLAAGREGNAAGASWDVADFEVRPSRQPRPRAPATEPVPFRDDFEHGIARWQRLGGSEGAYVFWDRDTRAGGRASLQLFKETHGGGFAARWNVTPFHLEERPVLRFDYRMPPQVRIGLILRVDGQWLSVVFSPDEKAAKLGHGVLLVTRDDQWHRAELNLLELVRSKLPDANSLWVTDLILADQSEGSLIGYAGNMRGYRYWLDNVELVPSGKKTGLPPPKPADPRPKSPWVSALYPDRLFHQSFEGDTMPWRDWCCGMVDFAPFGATGRRCAWIFAYKRSPWYSTMMWENWIDVNRHPILRFDYRIPSDATIGFAVNLEEFFYLFPFSKAVDLEKLNERRRAEYVTSLVPGCVADDEWHTVEIDLLAHLKRRFPERERFRIRDLRTRKMSGQNPLGVSCYFDNVSVHSRRPGKVQFVWQAPPGTTACSHQVDGKPDSVPDEKPEAGGTEAEYDLRPGFHYFHLRTRSADGKWGAAVHVPVKLE